MKILITENQLNRILLKEETLGAPLSGGLHINSKFGPRWGRMHNGVDYHAKEGTPIMSISDGVVKKAKFQGPTGKCGGTIIIQHDNGFRSSYCHMSRITTQEGGRVSQGDIIGLSGGRSGTKGAGNSQGPHLHFGLKQGRKWVDPELFVSKTVSDDLLPPKTEEGILTLWDGMGRGRKEKREEVRELQQDLIERNYILPNFGVDGKFGQETERAINAFQSDHGFDISPVITPEVRQAVKDLTKINLKPETNDPKAIKKAARQGHVQPWNSAVLEAITQASKSHGVDKGLLFTIANIESGGNPTAKNKRSGAAGLYQIMPKYFKSYGVTNETVWDAYINADAAAKHLKKNIRELENFLGRTPTNAEVYVSHNQGTEGFKIITIACRDFGNLDGKESLQSAAEKRGHKRTYGGRIYRNMKGNKGNHPCQFLDTWASLYKSGQTSYA